MMYIIRKRTDHMMNTIYGIVEEASEVEIARTGVQGDAQEIIEALNAWEWLKDARSSDLKQWELLPANYCINCKREHDDGDCYA